MNSVCPLLCLFICLSLSLSLSLSVSSSVSVSVSLLIYSPPLNFFFTCRAEMRDIQADRQKMEEQLRKEVKESTQYQQVIFYFYFCYSFQFVVSWSALFRPVQSCSILFSSILFYIFYSILFYSFLFYSILFYYQHYEALSFELDSFVSYITQSWFVL